MPGRNKETFTRPAVLARRSFGRFAAVIMLSAVIMLAGLPAVLLAGCRKKPDEQARSEQYPGKYTAPEPAADSGIPFDGSGSEKTLNDIIRAARTWEPAYKSWHGKHAPDFTLSDINGKQHRLSDYHGKNVMLIFWATWCGPCLMEIPDLIELRKTIGENELAMLAITNERPETVKKFVTQQNMNYIVLLDKGSLAQPYSKVNALPSAFFIDPDGRIKLATIGLIPLNDIKAILQANPPTGETSPKAGQ